MVKKIISGGQTGADRGGLFAGKKLGIETGGTAPKGWKTELGRATWLEKYGLKECKKEGYPPRTIQNIKDADGTVIFGSIAEKGTRLTFDMCSDLKSPCVCFHFEKGVFEFRQAQKYFKEWIKRCNIRVLNVAGNRESKNEGIEKAVKDFLIQALKPKEKK